MITTALSIPTRTVYVYSYIVIAWNSPKKCEFHPRVIFSRRLPFDLELKHQPGDEDRARILSLMQIIFITDNKECN